MSVAWKSCVKCFATKIQSLNNVNLMENTDSYLENHKYVVKAESLAVIWVVVVWKKAWRIWWWAAEEKLRFRGQWGEGKRSPLLRFSSGVQFGEMHSHRRISTSHRKRSIISPPRTALLPGTGSPVTLYLDSKHTHDFLPKLHFFEFFSMVSSALIKALE